MAPPPEYDKEPKAPDKSATNISTEDSKFIHSLVNDQHINSDHKPTNTVAAVEVENNKHVETLDDGQLRALLDEAITYKCPKDREGKSSLFKELLEEVEQDEQACEAAARTLSGTRGARRGGRGRRALPHSNSLQDLVAALAAEPAPRRHHHRHHAPAPAPNNVSARAIHGGSLPSGVDTSSLLSEEPARGAGYLATVRCVNPPPLTERRVSASDANTPAEMELLNRRSKPMFPMTYTARATLEIGSGSVCSGRAVTTTTASNQVAHETRRETGSLPSHRLPKNQRSQPKSKPEIHPGQKLMNALRPQKTVHEGGSLKAYLEVHDKNTTSKNKTEPRKPKHSHVKVDKIEELGVHHLPQNDPDLFSNTMRKRNYKDNSRLWTDNVDNWYKGLSNYECLYYADTVQLEKQKTHAKTENIVKKTAKITIPDNCTPVSSFECYQRDNIIPHNASYHSRERGNVVKEKCHYFSNTRNKDNALCRIIKNVEYNQYDHDENDSILRKQYRKQRASNLAVPTLSQINPRNFRPMTIGQPECRVQKISSKADSPNEPNKHDDQHEITEEQIEIHSNDKELSPTSDDIIECVDESLNDINSNFNTEPSIVEDIDTIKEGDKSSSSLTDVNSSYIQGGSSLIHSIETIDSNNNDDIELSEIKSSNSKNNSKNTFSEFFATQKELLKCLNNLEEPEETNEITTTHKCAESTQNENTVTSDVLFVVYDVVDVDVSIVKEWLETPSENNDTMLNPEKTTNHDGASASRLLAEVPNNSLIFLTMPQPLTYPYNTDNTMTPNDNTKSLTLESNNNDSKTNIVRKRKEKQPLKCLVSADTKKEIIIDNKNALKVQLFQSLFKNIIIENPSGNAGVSAITGEEVDSAISFSCITTPEVVASCNTTSSSAQSAVAVDPKPRSMISSSFNGLPLSRPNYGSTGSSATDDYKKSLDENGNSVQGFSSPLSGSSQHKKPRRKKSSKNETVIDCQQIDGYQGDKDVNELLRFIESNADNSRAPKLGRVKHKDDSDDKGGKKRSTERRKDKENKIKRASSLEELSRTKIEDLTDVAESPLRGDKKDRRSDNTPAKAERRSWGDDARDALAYTDVPADSPVAAAELTDFQTVTKKRKPRRRADEHDREPAPRRARPPSPRPRRESAPPSDRSNDSNDDMDSVHSLPAAPPPAPPPAAPPPAPHASYAEIARTRHNIPDLIESCNFYAEGPGAAAAAGDAAGDAPGDAGGDAAGDADGYPALETRTAARRRDLKPAAPLRRERKERAPPPAEAPDVVADRRPPVILLDSAARPRDMDGVTFGFDINEQLLSTGARRPRCDLLRDAPEPAVRVRAGCTALRYVPPEPPPDTAALLQLVDYVGAAWEDVVRCGGGKVRYYSE